MTTTATESEQAFRLVPPLLPADGQAQPTIELSWCTSPETSKMLKDVGAKDIYILLVVENNSREVDRFVVPIKEPMRYLAFRTPGKNVVHATLVWRKHEWYKDGKMEYSYWELSPDHILTKKDDNGNFVAKVLRSRGGDGFMPIRNDFNMVNRLDVQDSLVFEVPEEMFARSWWITKSLGTLYGESWFGKKAKDQCSMRRRAIATGISLPLAAVLAVILAVVTAVFFVLMELYHLLATAIQLLFGLRGINYAAFLHPWDSAGTRWKELGRSVWLWKAVKDGKKTTYWFRGPAMIFYNPGTLGIGALIGGVIMVLAGNSRHHDTDYVLDCVYAMLALATLLLVVTTTKGSPLGEWIGRKLDERAERKQAEFETSLLQDLDLLACEKRPTVTSYSSVPKSRRTIRLRYQHVKAKVCQPFAT